MFIHTIYFKRTLNANYDPVDFEKKEVSSPDGEPG